MEDGGARPMQSVPRQLFRLFIPRVYRRFMYDAAAAAAASAASFLRSRRRLSPFICFNRFVYVLKGLNQVIPWQWSSVLTEIALAVGFRNLGF